ncbi:GNAT family N-acetyltransferase [Tundrisphaera sp. TA3]|uniref:GNAT family N-acetyltransferase n=1 Tax=Tundrisphaera sp. TA3 TaxID=3435775 RepID=UPI003EBCA316
MISTRPIPIGPTGLSSLVGEEDPSHRLVALRHAAIHADPVLLGDDPARPTYALLIREFEDRVGIFAVGCPDAALPWLAGRFAGRPVILAAPSSWRDGCTGRVRIGMTRTHRWFPGRPLDHPDSSARRLGLADLDAFAAVAPPWAAWAWGSPGALIEHGGAYGIAHQGRFIALAWAFEADRRYVKVGVATDERYWRLGLGRQVAGSLIGEILGRGRVPLWTTTPENEASHRLAESLGFGSVVDEPLIFWTPGAP